MGDSPTTGFNDIDRLIFERNDEIEELIAAREATIEKFRSLLKSVVEQLKPFAEENGLEIDVDKSWPGVRLFRSSWCRGAGQPLVNFNIGDIWPRLDDPESSGRPWLELNSSNLVNIGVRKRQRNAWGADLRERLGAAWMEDAGGDAALNKYLTDEPVRAVELVLNEERISALVRQAIELSASVSDAVTEALETIRPPATSHG